MFAQGSGNGGSGFMCTAVLVILHNYTLFVVAWFLV